MTPQHACRICRNRSGNAVHVAREMMFGTRDSFPYLECGACGCVAIVSIPADLGRHYASSYYSLQDPARSLATSLKDFVRRARADHVFGSPNLLGRLTTLVAGAPAHKRWFELASVSRSSSILDVGCGSGRLLRCLHAEGFTCLTGVDPFFPVSKDIEPGLRVISGRLADIRGAFDLVMAHHSLEHMPDQAEAMRELRRLVAPSGTVLIRVPLAGSWAWRTYGVHWFQLDAPRHLCLHSERSLRLLAEACGLEVTHVEYDSTDSQIWRSEQYKGNIAFAERTAMASRGRRRDYTAFVRDLNAKGDGDQACFYLRPSSTPPRPRKDS